MSELVRALLQAAWTMAKRGCERDEIARELGIDKWTAADVVKRCREQPDRVIA